MHLNTQECTDQLNQLGGGANYEADTLWSYELGLKTQLLDRRLSIEGSVYHINWSNIISAVHVPLCATHISKNLGDAKSDGFDLSVKALRLAGRSPPGCTVGYTNARYSSDSDDLRGDAGTLGTGDIRRRSMERDRGVWRTRRP